MTKTMYVQKVVSVSGHIQYHKTPDNPTPGKIPQYANKREGRAANLERTNNIENQILMDNKYKNVMALNLNQTNFQFAAKRMVDEILELYPNLKKEIVILGTGMNNHKRIGRMCCFLISLFVGWKSNVVVRYGRRTSWHTAIKTPLKKDGELSKKFGYSLKPYSEQYEIIALNDLVDTMNKLGLLKIKMGFIIPETQERYQTRLHITDDLREIFKRYEDQIDMNLIQYLNDVEFITAKKSKMSTKLHDIIIKNERKEVLSIEDIKESFDQQLKDKGLYEQAKEIKEIYKDIKVEMKYDSETNKDIVQKSRLISENDGVVNDDGNIEITNIHMQQVFNNSSLEEGGRRYNAYQNCPKKIRETFIINGEETIQLDMQASQINMLYHLENKECPHIDPYDIFENDPNRNTYDPEFLKAMRKITKQSILIMLNSDNYNKAFNAIKNDSDVIKNLPIIKQLNPKIEERFRGLSENEINIILDTESTENEEIIDYNTIEYIQYMNNINCWETKQQDEFTINKTIFDESSPAYTSNTLDTKDKTLHNILRNIKLNHKMISKYFYSGYGIKLQTKESVVVSETIIEMGKEHKKCTLSVHDEIIVPISKAAIAHDVFIKNYKQEFNGYSCVLTDSTNKNFKESSLYLSQTLPYTILPLTEELSKPVPSVKLTRAEKEQEILNIFGTTEEDIQKWLHDENKHVYNEWDKLTRDDFFDFKDEDEETTEVNQCLNEIGRENNILIDPSTPVKSAPIGSVKTFAQIKKEKEIMENFKKVSRETRSPEQIELETYVSVFD